MAGENASGYDGVYADGPSKVLFLRINVDGTSSTISDPGFLMQAPHESSDPNTNRSGSAKPPKPMIIAIPEVNGRCPLILFQHGYMLQNLFYRQLMQQVASHGFIVAAPQMYEISGPDATEEIENAVAVLNWLLENLSSFIPVESNLIPDLEKVVVSGHSRGGKVAFGLALAEKAKSGSTDAVKLSAIVALDPVDGSSSSQTQPPILTFNDHSLKLGYPTLVVGSGLGSQSLDFLTPPCAPAKFGHQAFFAESSAPAFHFVPSDYGHMDFLDDDTPGLEGVLSHCLCKNGSSRLPMRRTASGLMISFLQAALFHQTADFEEALKNPSTNIPIAVQPPESYGTFISSSDVTSFVTTHTYDMHAETQAAITAV